MTSRTRRLVTSLVLLTVLLGVPVLLTWRAVRQERLDRALIVAVGKNDAPNVGSLLAQGADADAHGLPLDARSFWQQVTDRLRGRQENEPSTQSALDIAISWPGPYIDPSDESPDEVPSETVNSNLAVVNALLDHGADVNSKSHGWLFVIPENTEPAKEIEDAGCTPLMTAVTQNRVECVKLLLQHGADLNIKGNEGITALTLARSGGHSRLVQMLKQAGAKE